MGLIVRLTSPPAQDKSVKEVVECQAAAEVAEFEGKVGPTAFMRHLILRSPSWYFPLLWLRASVFIAFSFLCCAGAPLGMCSSCWSAKEGVLVKPGRGWEAVPRRDVTTYLLFPLEEDFCDVNELLTNRPVAVSPCSSTTLVVHPSITLMGIRKVSRSSSLFLHVLVAHDLFESALATFLKRPSTYPGLPPNRLTFGDELNARGGPCALACTRKKD